MVGVGGDVDVHRFKVGRLAVRVGVAASSCMVGGVLLAFLRDSLISGIGADAGVDWGRCRAGGDGDARLEVGGAEGAKRNRP